MTTKLYVGNLSYSATEDDIKGLFEKYGTVRSAEIVKDRYSGQSKGFGFVEMGAAEEAQKCLDLNGQEFLGRNLNVSEARPRQEGGSRGGFGGGGNRGGGHRGGGERSHGGGFGGGGGKRRSW